MSDIKRYRPAVTQVNGLYVGVAYPSPDGYYVSYHDHVRELSTAKETIAAQQARIVKFREEIQENLDIEGQLLSFVALLKEEDDLSALNAAKKEAQRDIWEKAILVCHNMNETSPRKQYQEASLWLATRFNSMIADLDKEE